LIELGYATIPSGHRDIFQRDVEIVFRCKEDVYLPIGAARFEVRKLRRAEPNGYIISGQIIQM
jgi:hypothetical protein